jgi:hypothetical protein
VPKQKHGAGWRIRIPTCGLDAIQTSDRSLVQEGVLMICSVRGSALALIAASFCLALGAPAQAGCVGLSGTADGFDKETAVSRAQLALADYVKQYKAGKRLRAVTASAMRASPHPYWRSSVSENMFCLGIQCGIYKPDIVNASSYTVCWHGVVSPYVCTSGAKVCW